MKKLVEIIVVTAILYMYINHVMVESDQITMLTYQLMMVVENPTEIINWAMWVVAGIGASIFNTVVDVVWDLLCDCGKTLKFIYRKIRSTKEAA